MATFIDYNNFGKSTRQIEREKTERYRQIMLNEGREELSKEEFLKRLEELNYKIDNSCTFNYYNNYNEHHYLARSMSYTDKKTGQSYAHFEQRYSNGDNLAKLQKLRDCFVFDKGRIWDL